MSIYLVYRKKILMLVLRCNEYSILKLICVPNIESAIRTIQITHVKIMEVKNLKQVMRELLMERIYHCYSEYIFEVKRYEDVI